eukprot:CAMPEP_0204057906 /NCGR_PEP_ID=MMETSP0360-20130528/134903_1 /ASSEMBLY_ACC=CAM_ASM_000342 /TAXON_ID=268821 /ORGANISM="Scrippsiella Hangoei, Strain SHTV-5" /LENGTH=174 /DNA_ID=CAMNT_0051005407 /DNA_START=266 /DNA_END=793 /DNA_ORIENTATION=+
MTLSFPMSSKDPLPETHKTSLTVTAENGVRLEEGEALKLSHSPVTQSVIEEGAMPVSNSMTVSQTMPVSGPAAEERHDEDKPQNWSETSQGEDGHVEVCEQKARQQDNEQLSNELVGTDNRDMPEDHKRVVEAQQLLGQGGVDVAVTTQETRRAPKPLEMQPRVARDVTQDATV